MATNIENLKPQTLLGVDFYTKLFESAEYKNTLTRDEVINRILKRAEALKIREDVEGKLKVLEEQIEKEQIDGGDVQKKEAETKHALYGNGTTCFPEEVRKYPILYTGEYYVYQDSICKVKYDEERKAERRETLIKQAIIPVAILKSINSPYEKIKLAALDQKTLSRWKELDVSREMIASARQAVQLSKYGLAINSENARHFVKYMDTAIAYNSDIIPELSFSEQLGWNMVGGEMRFIPYSEKIMFSGDDVNPDWFIPNGSLEEWKATCSDARENIVFRIMQGVSAASPLLKLVGGLPFISEVWGGSGTGKTVLLHGCASIWGNPANNALVFSMTSTYSAIIRRAGILNSYPVMLDELQAFSGDAKELYNLMYSLTGGMEKNRQKSDMSKEKAFNWCSSALITGEEPISRANAKSGVLNRIIEIEATGPIFENPTNTVEAFLNNYGHAGKALVLYFQNNTSSLKEYYRNSLVKLLEMGTASKQATAAAAILTGDYCLCETIFSEEKPMSEQDIFPFLKQESDIDISKRAYEWFENWVARNVIRFRDIDENVREGAVRNTGELWGELSENGDVCIVLKDVLARSMSRETGISLDAVKRAWAENGLLIKNSLGRYFHQTTAHGIKGNYAKVSLQKFVEVAPDDEIFT